MTITQIVLASLNILVAAGMFYLAGQSAYARAAWTAHVRSLERQRDGLQVGDWLKDLEPAEQQRLRDRIVVDESTFMTLEPAERENMLSKLRGPTEGQRVKSEEGIRAEIASLFWNTGERSYLKPGTGEKVEYEARAVGDDVKKTSPKLLLNPSDPAVATWARKLGPAGFTRLVRAAIQQAYPQIALDTREAASKVYFARARLADAKAELAKTKAEVELLGKRRDVEKQLLSQAEAENAERRREITKLEADVEEAMAALTLSLGREADRKRLYAEIQEKTAAATSNSDKLVNAIQAKEDN